MKEKIFLLFFSLLIFTGCHNTKVKYDILEPSNIEIAAEEHVKLNNSFDISTLDFPALSELEVTDAEVEVEFENYLKEYYEPEKITNKPITKGDHIFLRMVCEYQGNYLDNYRIDGELIEIGNNKFGKLLDDSLIGIIIDEQPTILTTTSILKKDIVFTNKELQSLDSSEDLVQINCYISLDYIQGKMIPPQNLDGVVKKATHYKYSGEAEFKQYIYHLLTKRKQNKIIYDVLDILISSDYISVENDINYIVRTEKNILNSYYLKCASSFEQSYVEFIYSLGFSSLNDFKAKIDATATKLTKEKLVFYYLGKQNNWILSDEEYSTKAKAKSIELSYDSLNSLLSVYGSDLIRWEIYKDYFADLFLEKYINGYRSDSDNNCSNSSDLIDPDIIIEKSS